MRPQEICMASASFASRGDSRADAEFFIFEHQSARARVVYRILTVRR